jgi:predicted dehydrogenase
MSPPVRIAVIGLGLMGTRWARAIAEHPGARLALVCDVLQRRARERGAQLGAAYSTDPVAAAGDPDLHGVVVCTPEHLHTDAALAAIAAGTPVAVEKPLAHTVADADRIVDAAARAGVPVLAAHILRFEPRYAAIRSAIDDGLLGTVQAVSSERIGVLGDQRVLAGRTSIPLYYGTHELDLARWYAGEVVTVAAHRSGGVLRAAGFDQDDLYSVLLGFDSGAHGTCLLGWSLPDATAPHGTSGFTVFGERGFARVEQADTGLVVAGRDGRVAVDTWYAPQVHGRTGGALANQVDHFLRVARGGTAPLCSAADGAAAVRLSLAVAAAAERGDVISVDGAASADAYPGEVSDVS